MVCLLSQPLLGHSDPAAWYPVNEWQAHSQLPLGAAALWLFALEQTNLRLTPLWQGHGSALPQQLCKWRGGSRIGEEQGCLWAGGCSVWAAEQTLEPAEQGKRKGCAFQNKLLLTSCLLWKTECSLQSYFTFQKKKKEERLPRVLKCGICSSFRKELNYYPVNSFCLLFLCEEKHHHPYSYPSTELHFLQDILLTFTPNGWSYYMQMHLWWIMMSQKHQTK